MSNNDNGDNHGNDSFETSGKAMPEFIEAAIGSAAYDKYAEHMLLPFASKEKLTNDHMCKFAAAVEYMMEKFGIEGAFVFTILHAPKDSEAVSLRIASNRSHVEQVGYLLGMAAQAHLEQHPIPGIEVSFDDMRTAAVIANTCVTRIKQMMAEEERANATIQ